jgi:hypothetical protein
MKFHSDLFGWEYVWRNFSDENSGSAVTDSGDEEGKLLYLSIPIEGTPFQVIFTPEKPHGKQMAGAFVLVSYPGKDDFTFSIFQEKAHHRLSKVLGMQDLQVQDPAFDSKFMIQGTDPKKVLEIFGDHELRESILLQPPTTLHIDANPAKSHHQLGLSDQWKAVVYHFEGTMDKLHQLQGACEIVVSVLEKLSEMGVIHGAKAAHAPVQHEEVHEAAPVQKRLRSPLLDR